MTVRQRIDQLISEPPVADLGYPADQRLVATVVLGLKLLAGAIDELEGRLAHSTPSSVANPAYVPTEIQDITAEIHDITEQVGELAKIIKKVAIEKE